MPGSPASQYSTWQVSRIAGVTLRQLQWWDEQGVLQPDRANLDCHHLCRAYSPDELLLACVLGALRKKGMSLQACRRVLAFLGRKHFKGSWLISDGKRRHALAEAGGLQAALDNIPARVYMLYLDGIKSKLELREHRLEKKLSGTGQVAHA